MSYGLLCRLLVMFVNKAKVSRCGLSTMRDISHGMAEVIVLDVGLNTILCVEIGVADINAGTKT